MNAYDFKNYVAGHRFSDESEVFYDSESKSFKDLAGFGPRQNVNNNFGEQVFENVGNKNRRGLVLDGTNILEMFNPVAWGGSTVQVFKYDFIGSGTASAYITLDGTAAISTSNSRFTIQHFSGTYRFVWQSYSNLPTGQMIVGSGESSKIVVVVASLTQRERRNAYTVDGVNVTASTPLADSDITGFSCAPCRGNRTLYGVLSGVQGDTTLNPNFKVTLLEQHFFKSDIVTDQLGMVKAYIEQLKEYYSAS